MAKVNPAESGDPNVGDKRMQQQSNMLSFLTSSIAEKWEKVEKEFYKQMSDGKLFKENFGACIGLNEDSKNFAYELFDVLSNRKQIEAKEGITLQQLKEFWEDLRKDDLHTRLQIFFDLCDKNDDNKISKEEVKTVLEWTASANKLTNIKDIESYVSLIMEELDPDGNGFIEFEHMELLVKELANSEQAKMLQSQNVSAMSNFVRETIETIKEKRQRIWVFTLWLAINLGLFVWKFIEYKEKEEYELMGYCTGIAKGSAETLKFNMALILFLGCRGTLTTLKSTFLSSIFPFDDHIYFHMLVGAAISVATFVHMIMHLGCGFPILSRCLSNKLKQILGPSYDSEEPGYFDLVLSVPGVTGILMFIIMAYCFILAIPSVRRSKKMSRESSFHHLIGFNAFWYAHHLLILVYLLMILHGYFKSLAWDWLERTTWMYIVFPVFVYTSERLSIGFNKLQHQVHVNKAVVYSGNDLVTLCLTKPKDFKYKSGMYLFVKCPDVSKFEWHPFSITSAPGDDYLSLHIRKAGDWTEELINKFEKACEDGAKTKRGGLIRLENKTSGSSERKYPEIHIKGPYGAPAQNYKDFDILLLIGLGIGATPMISVLKDLLNNIKTNHNNNDKRNQLVKHDTKLTNPSKKSPPKIPKKAYFYWVTRTQESFQWFKGVMNDVAEYDNEKVIEMKNHLSSMQSEGDARSIFLTILQNIQKKHDEHYSRKPDIISGSRIRARYGKPEWEKVFAKLESEHKGSKIGVFYCGPTNFKYFQNLCEKHSLGSTKFHFHKENF